jgi:hypothetical protein
VIWLSTATLALVVMCCFRWRRSGLPVPIFPLFAVFVYLEFGLGIFLRHWGMVSHLADAQALRFDPQEVDLGALLGTSALGVSCLGYLTLQWALDRVQFGKGVPARLGRLGTACVRTERSRQWAIIVALLVLLGEWVISRYVPRAVGGIALSSIAYASVALVSITVVFPGPRVLRGIGLLVLLTSAISAITSGLLYSVLNVVWPAFVAASVRWGWSRLAAVLVVAVPLVAIANSYKHEFRSLVWRQGEDSLSALREVTQLRNHDLLSSLESVFRRHDYSASLGRAAAYSGALGGSTFGFVLYGFVPRAVWPNKPVRDEGNRVGHLLEVLDPDDLETSANVHGFSEGILAYGVYGVILVACAFSLIWYFLERICGTADNAISSACIAAVLGRVWSCESGLSTLVVGTAASFIGLVIVGLLVDAVVRAARAMSQSGIPRRTEDRFGSAS